MGQTFRRRGIIFKPQRHQLASRDRGDDEMLGHAAPAEACQQEIQPSAEVDKSPQPCTREAISSAAGIDRIGEHELNMRFQVAARCRPSQAACNQTTLSNTAATRASSSNPA